MRTANADRFLSSLKRILALSDQFGYARRTKIHRGHTAREYRMSIAENLLRLHRWQLEEQRRYVAELEALARRLRADAHRLVDHIDADASLRQRAGQGGTDQRPCG